ncbi:hypothetical protein AJ80_06240 [Polytolypa hystricis UAMH7299]|uniref:Uncharacterized protein n=1 Tax=Polytolypa hystricis (strain UAMH7299) TaxID=1447883 RepID=A0A2B7XXF0_POLH7|nr:hypothetical protein AJ80_06240 [Polytolypa hystricis UAMH7299]
MSTVERNLLRGSSMSSPKLSMRREVTPPTVSDPALLHIHDRLNQLDSKVLELRSCILTKETYVDRRNREDDHIRKEFERQYRVSERIDSNVCKVKADVSVMKTDLSHLKAEIVQLRTHVLQLGSKDGLRQSDIAQLQNDVNQLQLDIQQLRADLCTTRTELSQLHTIVSQLRIDVMTLQRETSKGFGEVFSRFSVMESRMKHMERIRFNSLAHTPYAPITPVPVVEDDGSLRWPEYFPRTVWKFWSLKKRHRVHRLVELAEFFELEGYQYWSRIPHAHDYTFHEDGNHSDSSDSSDLPSDITRAEAARQFPEACHQALAATLGLVYYKIRNEVGEGPHGHMVPTAVKRLQDEVGSLNSAAKPKAAKLSRTGAPDMSAVLHRLATGPSIDSKSIVSEGLDKLGWNTNLSQVSDETMSKLKGIVSDEVNAALLKALEHGRVKLKPSALERGRLSPTDSGARLSVRPRSNEDSPTSPDDEVSTIAHTVATELISPLSARDECLWAPEPISETSSP